MVKYERTLSNMKVIERLGMTFRRDPASEFLVTECGQWVINAYYPNKTTHVGRHKTYRYLRMDGPYPHNGGPNLGVEPEP